MLPYRNNKIAALGILVFFLAAIGYAYFEAQNILNGPRIALTTPDSPISVSEPLVHIQGSATNITELELNGDPVSVTETGEFDEAVLLANGYNTEVLTAQDQFGRTTTKTLQIIYMASSTAAHASTSPPTNAATGTSPDQAQPLNR